MSNNSMESRRTFTRLKIYPTAIVGKKAVEKLS
jgi:hypothetical protein